MRGFIQPRVLLLLAKKATHGYELMESLRAMAGAENLADPGLLYRTLRQFETDGLVTSEWDMSGHGPARRVYRLTAAGKARLEGWATDLRQTKLQLDGFIKECELLGVVAGSTRNQKTGR